MQLLAMLAGIFLLGAALLPAVFAAEPFPDQPGALSPEEIKAATNALRHITLSAAQYRLAASGKRESRSPLPAYAVFDYPPEKVSERIEARRRIVCNFVRVTDKWQCAREQLEVRVQTRGVEHVISLFTLEGITGDGRTAGEVVDFMYSPCFGDQYRALAGPRAAAPPLPRSINSMIVLPGSINVLTGLAGAEDTHALEPDAGPNRQACAFRLTAIHLGKGGALVAQKGAIVTPPPAQEPAYELTEKAAQERAEQAAKERAKEDAERAEARKREAEWAAKNPTPHALERKRREQVGLSIFWLGLLCSLATPFAPLFARRKSRSIVAATAIGLSVAGALLSILHIPLGDAGHEIYISGLAIVLSWVAVAVYVVRAAMGGAKIRK
jgi:hypothetical protein